MTDTTTVNDRIINIFWKGLMGLMRMGKYSSRALLLLTAGLILAGCSRINDGKEHRRHVIAELMDSAEVIMNDDPETAFRFMDSIDSHSISGRERIARYALLYSEAQYKNGIDAADDSLIMIAVRYYSISKNLLNRFRSYYMLGCTYNGLGQLTNAAVAFCNTIKAAGYQPGIYANTTFFASYIVTGQLAPDVDLWCAQYYSSCQSGVRYTKWQYSSSARIDGMLSYLGTKGRIDADFWYLNKNEAKGSTVTKITGKTTLSVADARAPKFKLYKGSKTLKEGSDYMIGGIRNNAKGQGYVYIKGIGAYGGYALIPITIADKTSGKDTQEVKCANYLTTASGAYSAYMEVPAVVVKATKIKKLKGKKKKFYIVVKKKPKANASGYQVKYSRNSDMSDSVVKKIGKKYNRVSKTIKTNARKRYYYVQVRTYKDSGGTRYYSSWSATKKVWVK